jgi:hypothetical protein
MDMRDRILIVEDDESLLRPLDVLCTEGAIKSVSRQMASRRWSRFSKERPT